MLIALTFLGIRNYEKTTYIKQDDEAKTCETDLFPIAVARLYNLKSECGFPLEGN